VAADAGGFAPLPYLLQQFVVLQGNSPGGGIDFGEAPLQEIFARPGSGGAEVLEPFGEKGHDVHGVSFG
jgi:hypothetical protein